MYVNVDQPPCSGDPSCKTCYPPKCKACGQELPKPKPELTVTRTEPVVYRSSRTACGKD